MVVHAHRRFEIDLGSNGSIGTVTTDHSMQFWAVYTDTEQESIAKRIFAPFRVLLGKSQAGSAKDQASRKKEA